MNLFSEFRDLVLNALAQLQSEGVLPEGIGVDNVTVEPPRDTAHGEMTTNAAMVLAKRAGMKPRDIADLLAEKLSSDDRVTSAEVAGPGFLNLRLAPSVWQGVPTDILKQGTDYGRSNMGQGQKVNVEYISANPTGPLHVGHARGAVFGDVLANLLAYSGYEVTREYYINDGGAQVDALARSAYERYREANGLSPEIAEGMYPGDYLIPVGKALKEKYGDALIDKPECEWLEKLRNFATDAMMNHIRADLKALGIEMDVYFSEKSLYGTGKIEAALHSLDNQGLICKGILEPPRGKKPEDWEPREQTLFKSTEHGDDVDRPVRKPDGSWTYFAGDIAYHHDKLTRGFDALINVLGADHDGYVKRMKAIVSALSNGKVALDIKLTQLVNLWKNGAPFRMSKRTGTFVTLRDVVDQVGSDVTRFIMVTRKNDVPLDFDFDKVLEQSRENPVFYVQYAHARVMSVLRRAAEAGIAADDMTLSRADMNRIDHDSELAVIKKLAEWPRLVEISARANEPHRIATYLHELAGEFHALWNRGNDDARLRFIQEGDITTSRSKIALARAVSVVVSAGLGILGVAPAQEMRQSISSGMQV